MSGLRKLVSVVIMAVIETKPVSVMALVSELRLYARFHRRTTPRKLEI